MGETFMWCVVGFCGLWSLGVTLVTGGILHRVSRKMRDSRVEIEDSWRDR
jgi:hypothetical protein